MNRQKIIIATIVGILLVLLGWFFFLRPEASTDNGTPTVPAPAETTTPTLPSNDETTISPAPSTSPLADEYEGFTLDEIISAYAPSTAEVEVTYIWIRDNSNTFNLFANQIDEAYTNFDQVEKPSDFSRYSQNLTNANATLKTLATTTPDPVIQKSMTLLSGNLANAVTYLNETGQYGLNAEQGNLTEAERTRAIEQWSASYEKFLQESIQIQDQVAFLYGYMDSLTNPEIVESGKLG